MKEEDEVRREEAGGREETEGGGRGVGWRVIVSRTRGYKRGEEEIRSRRGNIRIKKKRQEGDEEGNELPHL